MTKRIINAVTVEHRDADGNAHASDQGAVVELTPEEEQRLDALGSALVPVGFESFAAYSSLLQDAYRSGRGDPEAAGRLAEARRGGIADLSAGPTPDEGEPVSGEPVDVAALAEHIRTAKPSTDETVAFAEGDPERARAVLEAERQATGGTPRKEVVKALKPIAEG